MVRARQGGERKSRLWLWVSLVVLVFVVGLVTMMFWPWRPRPIDRLFSKQPPPLNIGHRGAAGLAPENTMLAFRAAMRAGAHGVELDVMETRDKKLIVFHDQKLQKRLERKGRVRDMTLAQLNKIDLSIYYRKERPVATIPPEFRKAKIPTLREVLTYYKLHSNAILNIEIKNKDFWGRGVEAKIAELIREFGFEHRTIVSSFNPFSVRRFRKAAPKIPTGLIYADVNVPIYIRKLWFLWVAKPDALHPNHEMVDQAYMEWARSKGFTVNVWTVNETKDMERMLRLGVSMIITNYPDRLQAILQKMRGDEPTKTNTVAPPPDPVDAGELREPLAPDASVAPPPPPPTEPGAPPPPPDPNAPPSEPQAPSKRTKHRTPSKGDKKPKVRKQKSKKRR